jgi:hypothetical protein
MSVLPVPPKRNGSAKIPIHRRNRGKRRECERDAEPIASGINVTVLTEDYVGQFHDGFVIDFTRREFCLLCSPHGNDKVI